MRRTPGLVVAALLVTGAGIGAAAPPPFAWQQSVAPENADASAIELLGSLQLAATAPDGTPVTGLSGLGWDADERLLYAVSDRGFLLHLRPVFEEGRLTDVAFVAGFRLRDREGRALKGAARDAEDLVVRNGGNGIAGDTELLVSFERQPRVVRYSAEGHWLGDVPLPLSLSMPAAYASPNQALEGLAEHPVYGIVAAPEASLRDDRPGTISFFAMNGKRWSYAPTAAAGSSPTALEALPDGRLVVLERAFVSVFWPLVITLRTAAPGEDSVLDPRTLAVLDTSRGWLLDNFEGLARHEGDRFFMVSDDNGNEHQRTLLVYFRLPGIVRS